MPREAQNELIHFYFRGIAYLRFLIQR